MESDNKLFLLDAYALIYRAYYAFIKNPRINSKGFNTSAILGFVNTLEEVLKKENPTHIGVAFDPAGPTFRHEAFEQYKAQREETPEAIRLSVPIIKEIIRAYRIPILEVAGYEADDVIGTLATEAGRQGIITYMMTPDKDYGQLVSDKVFMYRPKHTGGFEVMGVDEVKAKFDIQSPAQVIDMLGLMGDSSDNIPGCPGVGETTIKASIEATATHKAGAINYTLIVRNASAELPYSTDFKSGLGDWINYTLAGTTVWESTTYGAQANGHGKGASEVYLVSPSVKAPNIILAFSSEKGYTGNDLQLFYSTDFDPSSMSQPSDASWTEITDKATWATSQETTESGNIELNNLTAPIRFAFKYTCTAEESARWTITNLSISANNSTGIEEATANEMKVINGKGQITIETDEAMPIAIYALTGAQVRQIELVEGTNIIELPAGIYLIGNKKVVVF